MGLEVGRGVRGAGGMNVELYTLGTSQGTSRQVPTCDSAHSRRIYNAAPLGNQAADTMIRYPTQSHDRDTQLNQSTSYPINAERQARKQQVSTL